MLSEPMLRSFLVIATASAFAGVIFLLAMLQWSYFPAYAFVNLIYRYAAVFVFLFLSVAFLEIIRLLRAYFKGTSYFGAQSFVDITLIVLVISTFITGGIKTESFRTVQLGNQTFKFSSLDYPLVGKFGYGEKALFTYGDKEKIHSVYFDWGETYDFENVFTSGQARSFRAGVHEPYSPNLKEIDFSTGELSRRHGHVYLHEGDYVLEFFPTHGLSSDENIRFLKFISDNISQIRTDFSQHIVSTTGK